MAKKAKSCAVQTIRFKTKRGKVITFRGRSGGDSKHGGTCAHKRRKRTPQMAAIAKAGRFCAKKARPGTKTNIACLKSQFA